MVRWLKGLLNSAGPENQSHSANVTVSESRKFARFLAILTFGVDRQTTKETLRNSKNRFGSLGPLRTKIVRPRRVAPHQTKDHALRLDFSGFFWRTVRREYFAITHYRRMMLELSYFATFLIQMPPRWAAASSFSTAAC
jgi:hypothetical protein